MIDMMKRFLRSLSLLLCMAMLTVPALAAETEKDPAADRLGPVMVWGTLSHLEDGGLLVENSSDGLSEVVLHGEDIICLDAVTGESVDIDSLKDGDLIYAWVGPAMTLSLPPQATALLILTNIPADYAVPQFYEIVSVTPQAVPAIEPPPALTSKGEATKVLVFPYQYKGYVNCFEDGTVMVNSSTLAQKAKVTSEGETLLPVRAVAEALGMNVRWDAAKGAVVTYSEELAPENWASEALLSAVPGGAVYGYEADGTSFEAGGTCVIENGVTYLSETVLLNLLDLYLAV